MITDNIFAFIKVFVPSIKSNKRDSIECIWWPDGAWGSPYQQQHDTESGIQQLCNDAEVEDFVRAQQRPATGRRDNICWIGRGNISDDIWW